MGNTQLVKKWRWYAIAVTLVGVIIFSLPMIPTNIKVMLTIPLYAAFVYVYYNYISIKKSMASSQENQMPDTSLVKRNVKTRRKNRKN